MSTTPASVELRDALRGPVVAMTTPFNKDLSLDVEGLRDLTRFYVEQGIPNVIAAGSTGEFQSLTNEERKTVIQTVVEASAGRMTVIGCCAHSGTGMAVELAKFCEQIGCDGIMVTPPYYSFSGFKGLKKHFEIISDAVDIGIVLYLSGSVLRFPEIHGMVEERWVCPADLKELASVANVGAIKDASGNFGFHRDIIRELDGPDGMVAIMGSDGMGYHLWGYMWGSRCFLTGLGNVWPKPELEFFNCLEQGDYEGARRIVDEKEIEYLGMTKKTGKYWSCLKYLLDKMDIPGGYMRPPLLDLNEEDKKSMDEMCQKTGLDASLL